MKLSWFALLCAGTASLCGTAAFCQSPASRKIDPDKLFQMPQKFIQPAPDFKNLRSLPPMRNDLILQFPATVTPGIKPDGPQIDPRIILHPPWHGQSKGQDVAHRLYPNLKFLPIRPAGPIR